MNENLLFVRENSATFSDQSESRVHKSLGNIFTVKYHNIIKLSKLTHESGKLLLLIQDTALHHYA